MMLLPLFFVIFIFRFPAGVLVYWITTNLWTIGQQYVDSPAHGPPARARRRRAGRRGPAVRPRQRRAEPALAGVGSGIVQRARGQRAASTTAAQEEEALGAAAVSLPATTATAMSCRRRRSCANCWRRSSTASASRPRSTCADRRGARSGTCGATDVGLFIGRRGADDRCGSAPRPADRVSRRPCGAARRRRCGRISRRRRASALQSEADRGGGGGAASWASRWSSSRCRPPSGGPCTSILRERGDVETYSEGEEPARYLVVAPPRADAERNAPAFHVFLGGETMAVHGRASDFERGVWSAS